MHIALDMTSRFGETLAMLATQDDGRPRVLCFVTRAGDPRHLCA
jgi:hypothetical protein